MLVAPYRPLSVAGPGRHAGALNGQRCALYGGRVGRSIACGATTHVELPAPACINRWWPPVINWINTLRFAAAGADPKSSCVVGYVRGTNTECGTSFDHITTTTRTTSRELRHGNPHLSCPFYSSATSRLAASVLWCWSWEKEGRAVEVVPGI